jgi:hypothetical protein
VADDGSAALSATQTLHDTVFPQPHLVINEIMYHPGVSGAELIELLKNNQFN